MPHAKFYWAPPGSDTPPSQRMPWNSGRPHYVTPRVLFDQMPESDLIRLQGELKAEVTKRLGPKLQGFANFLAGVTHAMACRSFLRASMGHKPHGTQGDVKGSTPSGSTPTSGEMWNALDGARAERLLQFDLVTGGGIAGTKLTRTYKYNPLVCTAAENLKHLHAGDGGY